MLAVSRLTYVALGGLVEAGAGEPGASLTVLAHLRGSWVLGSLGAALSTALVVKPGCELGEECCPAPVGVL